MHRVNLSESLRDVSSYTGNQMSKAPWSPMPQPGLLIFFWFRRAIISDVPDNLDLRDLPDDFCLQFVHF